MMSLGRFTKFVYFLAPGAGFRKLGRGHVSENAQFL